MVTQLNFPVRRDPIKLDETQIMEKVLQELDKLKEKNQTFIRLVDKLIEENERIQINSHLADRVAQSCTFVLPMSISAIFIHEYSHILAMRSLFVNINPYMGYNFSPFYFFAAWGGTPQIAPGLKIEDQTARGIVSAAGPISDLTLIAISSITSWKLRNSNPKIALVFAMNAFVISLNTFSYALLTQNSSWGDFASIESHLKISHTFQTIVTGAVCLGSCLLFANTIRLNRNNIREELQKKI